jgi:hypothetical protein
MGCAWEGWEGYDGAPHPGPIALVQRGQCAFSQKARHAQRAGAAALLVEDSQDGAPMPPALFDDDSIAIAVAMISRSDGAALRAALRAAQPPPLLRVAVDADALAVPCMAAALADPQEAPALRELCALPPSAAAPPPASSSSSAPDARYLGYNYHFGRLNNHIFSLANALAFAQLLNRTLVFRDDPYLACHDVGAAASVAPIISLADFRRLSGGGAPEVVQYATEVAVTGRKYTHLGLPKLGFCDERVMRAELLPAAALASAAAAAAALASDARYIHLGLVYGQYPFAAETVAGGNPAASTAEPAMHEPAMHELDPALARIVAAIPVAAPVAEYAAAWRAAALPDRFVCVHWRQGDFATTRHCGAGDGSCVQTAAAAAARIQRLLREHSARTVFLATDASANARAELIGLVRSGVGESDGAHVLGFDAALCPGCGVPVSPTLTEQEVCGMADVCLLNKWSTFSLVMHFRRMHAASGPMPAEWWAK